MQYSCIRRAIVARPVGPLTIALALAVSFAAPWSLPVSADTSLSLADAYKVIAGKQMVDLTHTFGVRHAGVERIRSSHHFRGLRSQDPRALYYREARVSLELLLDGRTIRHPRRSAGSFRSGRHHPGQEFQSRR